MRRDSRQCYTDLVAYFSAMITHLPMPDADVTLYEAQSSQLVGNYSAQDLIDNIAWRKETIKLYGKTYVQPRLLEFYGDEGVSYVYSRKRYTAKPWTPLLADLRDIAEQVSGQRSNSVLANYYRDERDSMGFHADDEPELGAEPTIVSMSFGATRVFVMKHKTNKDVASVRLPLHDGSILVMKGQTQHHWVHGIEKKARSIGPRVNLTFRTVQVTKG